MTIRISERELRQIIREESAVVLRSHRSSLVVEMALLREGGVVSEGFREKVGDVVQLLAGSAAEYGITLATAGSGLPGGVAAETVVDAVFGAETVASAVKLVATASSAAGQFQKLFSEAVNAAKLVRTDLKKFYESVRSIVQRTLGLLGRNVQSKMKDLAEDLKDWVSGIIEKISDAISDAVKFVVPDQIAGFTFGEGVQYAIESLTTNCYDTLVSLLKRAGKFAEYATNPDKFPAFLEETIPKVAELCRTVAPRLEAGEFDKKALTAGAVGTLMPLGVAVLPTAAAGYGLLRYFGPDALMDFADTLDEKKPMIVKVARDVMQVVIPSLFALVAMMQIVLRGEFIAKGDEAGLKDYEDKAAAAKAFSAIASDFGGGAPAAAAPSLAEAMFPGSQRRRRR